jgi:hypothetical protein
MSKKTKEVAKDVVKKVEKKAKAVVAEDNGNKALPQSELFTYTNDQEGIQKSWPVELISVPARKVINHINEKLQKMEQLNDEARDLNDIIEANKLRLPTLLPSNESAIITKLEKETTH